LFFGYSALQKSTPLISRYSAEHSRRLILKGRSMSKDTDPNAAADVQGTDIGVTRWPSSEERLASIEDRMMATSGVIKPVSPLSEHDHD
jgi:hypothetical protein